MTCPPRRKLACRRVFAIMHEATIEVYPRMRAAHLLRRVRQLFVTWHCPLGGCDALPGKKEP